MKTSVSVAQQSGFRAHPARAVRLAAAGSLKTAAASTSIVAKSAAEGGDRLAPGLNGVGWLAKTAA
jgi:hypothetical protein